MTFEETLADVKKRDAQDEGRAVAPLKQADGAVLVDTSDLDADDAARRIADLARAAGT